MAHARLRISALLLGAMPLFAATATTAVEAGPFNGPATGITHHGLSHGTSGNWSGFAATGRSFTSVSADWVQPAVSCGSQTTYSSFWVGLDGDGSSTVEQTGTEADCSGGTAIYSSWYEMYPKYPVNFSNPVRPGDHFHASVVYNGSRNFTLTLQNVSRGWTKTISSKLSTTPALASAEVIAEAPSSSSGVLPLANFGTVNFSGSAANGSSLSAFGPDKITMASGSTTKAVPSSISGGSFSVAWRHS